MVQESVPQRAVRPRIDLSDDDEERVEQYANRHGIRMRRAYAELIRKALDQEEVEA